MQAGEWLAERGFGKAPIVVDLPEEPQASAGQTFVQWAQQLPLDLREALGAHLDQLFQAEINAGVAEVEAEVRAMMPADWSLSPPVQPLDGATKVAE